MTNDALCCQIFVLHNANYEPHMSDAPTATFLAARKQALQAALRELETLHADTEDAVAAVTLDQTKVGRLSRMDALQGQAISQEARRRREAAIRLTRSALARLDAGSYGDCQECSEWINPQRLQMDPAATLCISCAELAERE